MMNTSEDEKSLARVEDSERQLNPFLRVAQENIERNRLQAKNQQEVNEVSQPYFYRQVRKIEQPPIATKIVQAIEKAANEQVKKAEFISQQLVNRNKLVEQGLMMNEDRKNLTTIRTTPAIDQSIYNTMENLITRVEHPSKTKYITPEEIEKLPVGPITMGQFLPIVNEGVEAVKTLLRNYGKTNRTQIIKAIKDADLMWPEDIETLRTFNNSLPTTKK